MRFDDIVNKFGYDKVFAEFLKNVYVSLIDEFHDEEIVYNALMNTPIISSDNIYSYLKDNDMLDEDDGLVNEEDMKRGSGVYSSKPEIVYDQKNNKYVLESVKRVVVINKLDLKNPASKGTLIHELCHLIKSFYKEYVIASDILIEYSGFIEKHYSLTCDGDKVLKKLTKSIGVGLEEGLTSVNEEEISKKIVSSDYKVSGYGVVNALARNLINTGNLKEVVTFAEIYHDKNEIYNTLGTELFLELLELSDKIYKLNLLMFSYAFNPNKMKETAEQIKLIINTEYKELKERIDSNLKLS